MDQTSVLLRRLGTEPLDVQELYEKIDNQFHWGLQDFHLMQFDEIESDSELDRLADEYESMRDDIDESVDLSSEEE